MYSGYGIAFDGKGSWSFGNDYASNVVIFGVDNSSSSHADNHKNKFLVLSGGDTFGVNGSFAAPEKKFSINFTKAKTIFVVFPWVYIKIIVIVICLSMEINL